ncbi:putative hydro-lyase [Pseudonocardia sp. H11422]|uniref:putative hydro-lyase n=1 Tax=Pseudonocardia sp. H11422 TaxID=2835866 RepID=UPI001BDD78B8|nr:putative hydro-lyase [Pseudonocardia sp. H11422]
MTVTSTAPAPELRARLSPAEARAKFRAGMVCPTAGWSAGYTQTNLVVLPEDWAYDFLLFAQRNPRACPVLDVSDAGVPVTALAPEADLRTDLPLYRVWAHGEVVAEVPDVRNVWRPDLVAFQIGCSFSFEAALQQAGIPLRHVDQTRNVAMYRTNVMCRPAGRLHGPLVVSMRPVRAAQVATAVEVTARLPDVHGAPVHIGAPDALGIADLARPDYGDPVGIRPDELPVFWACGVTPQAAITAARPPFAITHAPGYMFIADVAG